MTDDYFRNPRLMEQKISQLTDMKHLSTTRKIKNKSEVNLNVAYTNTTEMLQMTHI